MAFQVNVFSFLFLNIISLQEEWMMSIVFCIQEKRWWECVLVI